MTVAAGIGNGFATAVLRSAADERLVEHIRNGSSEAFETLFDRYHPAVRDFCAHMLGSLDEADDAAQLTFLVAYHDLVRNAHPVSVRAWLYGIARHRCLMALRTRRDHPVRDVDDLTRRYELSADVSVRDEVRGLLADVTRLPDDQRAALVLAEIGGLSHAEIARVVGCPRRKVKALVFQARSSLRVARAARDTPCAEIREQLTTLRGPALTRATLRRHLEDCPGCRAYRDAIRDRRRRPVPRLASVPLVGMMRSVVGSVAGSGAGAGCLALTGGALGGAGLAVAVTIAATAPPPVAPVGRDVSVPVRPIAHAAAPASFPAQHGGSSVSAGVIGSRDTRGATLEGSDGAAGTGDEAGAPGTGEPSASQETPVESDLRSPDEPLGDADAAVPALDPAQPTPDPAPPTPDPAPPVLDESLGVPPAILESPATTRTSSGSDAALPAPVPAVAPRPSPTTRAPADTPRPSSTTPAPADTPRPNQTTPSPPDTPRPSLTTPARPDNPRPNQTTPTPADAPRPSRTTPSPAHTPGPSSTTPARPDTPHPSPATPARANDPRPRPSAPASPRRDSQQPRSLPAEPDDHRPVSTPARPDNDRPATAPARATGSSRPDDHRAEGARPAAPEPPPSGRDGARAPNDGSGAASREASPKKPRT